jgi:hypothetical protein
MKSHNMSKFGSTQELYTRIGSQLEKINNQPVGVEEFEVLLNDTRELYERALVLRYKAFEKYKSGDRSIVQDLSQLEPLDLGNQEGQLEIDLTKESQIPAVPKDAEQLVITEEELGFEFALFGEIPNKEKAHSEPFVSELVPEHKAHEPEKIIPEVTEKKEATSSLSSFDAKEKIAEVRVEDKTASRGSLFDLLSSSSQPSRLADQLKKSKIPSIPAYLTLNDRIRFAKNLFAGNADVFNSAVQLLDSQKSLMDALQLLGEYSERYQWNQEDKITMDFYELVERRYA